MLNNRRKSYNNIKIEALETHIKSLIRSETKTFIENVVLKGFKACFEADDLESDDVVRMDTDSMDSDEVEVVQTQLDDIKRDKEEMEVKQEEIDGKKDDLVNTSAALSLNESKSKEASAVLELMDTYEDPDYPRALKEVLKANPNINRKKLEDELNKYI